MIWASASNDVATSSFIRLSDKIRILLLVIALPNDSLFIQFVVFTSSSRRKKNIFWRKTLLKQKKIEK